MDDPRIPTRRAALGALGGGAAAALLAACGSSSPAAGPSASASAGGPASAAPSAGASAASGGPSASAGASISGSASASPSASPATYAGAKVNGPTLTVWADSVRIPALAKVSAAFTQKYQVNVKFQPFDFGTLFTQVQQAGPTGNGPDLWDCNFDWTGKLISAGLLAPVELGAKGAQFDKRSVAGYTQNGALYALPLTLESTNVFRNPALIPKRVETWDQFTGIAAGLAAKGVRYPFLHVPNAYVFNSMLTAFGGYLYKPPSATGTVNSKDVGIDNAGAIGALSYYAMLAKKKYQRPGVDGNVVAKVFAKQGGLLLSGPWDIATLQAAKAGFVLDPARAGPAGPAIPYLSARGLMVNKVGKQVALAQTYLTEFWANAEPMKQFATAMNLESAWNLVKAETDNPLVKAQIVAGKNAQPIPSDGRFNDYYQPMTDAMTLIVAGQTTPAQALKTVKAKFDSAA